MSEIISHFHLYLMSIATTLKIGIIITWSFTLQYVIATTSLWCWKKISHNDVTSVSISSWSTSPWKPNKKPISPQYRVPIFIFSLYIVLQDSYQADGTVMEIEEWKQKVPGKHVKSFNRVCWRHQLYLKETVYAIWILSLIIVKY